MRNLLSTLINLGRQEKAILLALMDGVFLSVLVCLAYAIRLSKPPSMPVDWWMVPVGTLSTLIALALLHYYRVVTRHFSANQVPTAFFAVFVASLVMAASAYMAPAHYTHRSVIIIYALLAFIYLTGSRRLIAWLVQSLHRQEKGSRIPIAIFGAGDAGIEAARALAQNATYKPVALVDDNKLKHKSRILGLPVVSRSHLRRLVSNKQVGMVLLAIPSASLSQRRDAILFSGSLDIPVKSIPRLPDILSGRSRIAEVRDVAIEDILGRGAVLPRKDLLMNSTAGKTILITGAGGSIGSELARQLSALSPRKMILLETSEYALYSIHKELAQPGRSENIDITCVLASVTDINAIEKVFSNQKVDTVYHAAAYKHVPIVESNESAGVQNNVLGTKITAEIAMKHGVDNFILISTDKAVRPTNVMGATKRLAEMVLQHLAQTSTHTIFSMVRFGNVLGSSGSVFPLFREQILKGGPVTVTDPDVTRYFMTIPEAAQLVIQAGGMARGGEVFLLDMGEPVRIVDLAYSMIHLMGHTVLDEKNPGGDIEIQYIGLRPGEKLYEELLIGDDAIATLHPSILRANEAFPEKEEFYLILEEILSAAKALDNARLRILLQQNIIGYQPADELPARDRAHC